MVGFAIGESHFEVLFHGKTVLKFRDAMTTRSRKS